MPPSTLLLTAPGSLLSLLPSSSADKPVVSSSVTKVSSLAYLPLNPVAGGSPYSLLTITGTYFDTGAAVAVGGLACSGAVVTGHTSIECAPPTQASAGSYNTVVTLSSTASTDTAQLAYYGPPALTSLTCLTVNGVDCTSYAATAPMSGAVVKIVGTGFPAAAHVGGVVVTVGGQACGSISLISTTELRCTAAARSAAGDAGAAQAMSMTTAGQTNTWTGSAVTLTYSEC